YNTLLRRLLNSYTASKGSLGNHMASNGWNLVPLHSEYYHTRLYKNANKSCSTGLKYQMRINRMPQLRFVMKDNCGDSSHVVLTFTKNLNNKINFSKIIEFKNFRPVSYKIC